MTMNIAANSFEICFGSFNFVSGLFEGSQNMKLAIAIAAASLSVAGAAAAAEHVTDVDYLKASRCRGIASGLGADTAGLDAFLKAESRSRVDFILRRGEDEASRAKRETRDANLKDRLSGELASTCTAYMGPGKTLAAQ